MNNKAEFFFLKKIIRKKLIQECVLTENTTYTVYRGTDEGGVYSGTNSVWHGDGIYFSDSKTEAGLHGNVKKYIIQLNNPLRLDKLNYDTSVQGSGIIKLFASIKGLSEQKYNGRTFKELHSIITSEENNFKPNNISYSEGNKIHFTHVFYEDGNDEYVIYNRTKSELADHKWIKSIFLGKILKKKYGIESLPVRISEAINPTTFSDILKSEGYDGVIAPNSTVFSGNEYVVFDRSQIKLVNHETINEELNESKVYYHGTTKSRADNIKKIGFYPQQNVNITDDYEEALEYANITAEDEGDLPEVINVYLKKGAKPKARIGLDSMAYDSKYILFEIKNEDIINDFEQLSSNDNILSDDELAKFGYMRTFRTGEFNPDDTTFFVSPSKHTWDKYFNENTSVIFTKKLYIPLTNKSFSSWNELRKKAKNGSFSKKELSNIYPEESGVQNYEQYEISPDDIEDTFNVLSTIYKKSKLDNTNIMFVKKFEAINKKNINEVFPLTHIPDINILKTYTKQDLKNLIDQLELGMTDILNSGDTEKAKNLNLLIGKVIDLYNMSDTNIIKEIKNIPQENRPILYLGDLEGLDYNTKFLKFFQLKDGEIIKLKINSKNEIFALNSQNEVIGFATKLSDKATDLSVVVEYQQKGIGTELLTQFFKFNPKYPTGGLTPLGRKTYNRVKYNQKSK